MDIYMEMLAEYGKESHNDRLTEATQQFIENEKKAYFKQLSSIPHRVCYPEEWAQPRPYDVHWQQLLMKSIKHVPYKRISHFREHLNRLQFTQFIHIPKEVLRVVESCITHQDPHSHRLYYEIKEALKKAKLTRYNEHIHYMTSLLTKQYIEISYDDHHDMFQLFLELEAQFCKQQRESRHPRKNMISYYLIVQLVLYLFHYHPMYKLPSIRDQKKCEALYCELLVLFTKTQSYQEIITLHFRRKKDCYFCHTHEHVHHFDQHVTNML